MSKVHPPEAIRAGFSSPVGRGAADSDETIANAVPRGYNGA